MNKLTSTIWIEKYLDKELAQNVTLDHEKYVEVRNFLFLWNIYEREFLDNKCCVGRIWANYGLFEPKQSVKDRYYDYLVKKYSYERKFKKLNLAWDGGTYEADVKAIIENKSPSNEEKRLVCMMVIWRYRNNLFHGGKQISGIWTQGKIFKEANAFLISGLSKKTGICIEMQ